MLFASSPSLFTTEIGVFSFHGAREKVGEQVAAVLTSWIMELC